MNPHMKNREVTATKAPRSLRPALEWVMRKVVRCYRIKCTKPRNSWASVSKPAALITQW